MRGGEAVAKILKMEGVDFIAGFPMNPLHDYCATEGIRFIKFRMERAAINCNYGYTVASFGNRTGVASMQLDRVLKIRFRVLPRHIPTISLYWCCQEVISVVSKDLRQIFRQETITSILQNG